MRLDRGSREGIEQAALANRYPIAGHSGAAGPVKESGPSPDLPDGRTAEHDTMRTIREQ